MGGNDADVSANAELSAKAQDQAIRSSSASAAGSDAAKAMSLICELVCGVLECSEAMLVDAKAADLRFQRLARNS
jgi:hypothetical protein